MTAALSPTTRLLDRLPEVRGRYSEDALLSRVTWFQVGGAAEVLFKPADIEDLQHFLKNNLAQLHIQQPSKLFQQQSQ